MSTVLARTPTAEAKAAVSAAEMGTRQPEIGEKAILHGLYKQIKGDFYTAVTRPPAVYRGNPFVIEAGLAYGKGPDQAAATPEAPAAPLAEGEQREDDDELARVIR